MERVFGDYHLSDDRGRLDLRVIHDFLARQSYWAAGISPEVVDKCVRHSFCIGAFHDGQQVGLVRVVTDYATFGHVMDVFVLPPHRGRGLAKQMMEWMIGHPDLQGFRLWTLGTQDAHGLYAGVGFTAPAHPEYLMERRRPDVYR